MRITSRTGPSSLVVSIIWLLIAILSTHARSIAINRHHFPDVSSKGALRGRATWNTCDWSTVEQSVEEAGEDLALCQKAFQTGTRLTCMMNPPTGFDSTYTEYAQLEDWGWSAASSKGVGIGFLNLNPVLNSLGSGTVTEPARWGSLSQTHSKAAKKGDYPATGAQYNNYVNLQEGIIVGYRNDGPVHVNNEKSEAQQIVSSRITKLRNFSDLFFLGLQKYASENSLDLSKIQHVIRYQITNEETINILQSIIGHEEPEDHKTWTNPYVFNIDTLQAKAAIATPNGRGVAWFLGQHKTTGLGVKVIDQVKIWNCADDPEEDYAEWCMYFHIVEAPLR